MIEQIKLRAHELQEEMTSLLREVIAIPSFSGQEGPVIDRLKQAMLDFGYDEVNVDPMGNLLGRIGHGGRVIAIDGHVDTVDVGNPDLWSIDPFKGDLQDDIVYGRGAGDQKAGVVAAVFAGRLLKELAPQGDYTLFVVGSVQEEDCEGLCWQYIIREDKIVPEIVILTEPSNLSIAIGQRGRIEIEVTTTGVSCHGSAPERGVNAIYKIVPIIQEIKKLNERLAQDRDFGKATVAVTDVRSETPSLCAVPDRATIHLDRRLTRAETLQSTVEQIEQLASVRKNEARVQVLEYNRRSYTGLSYPTKMFFPTWEIPENSPLVRTAVDTYVDLFREQPKVGRWVFSTNGVATKGMFDIPTIGFGPGNEVHAHAPTDQVPVEHVVKATEFYAAFVMNLVSQK
jgi:putative selenium metabolism hydrolase